MCLPSHALPAVLTPLQIMALMTFAITPLLLFRAFIRLLFTILDDRLPLTIGYTIEVREGLILARTLLEGLMYLAAMGVLVYLVVRRGLWEAQPESSAHHAAPGKFAGQEGPPTQYFMPPAQFPGQWGYPQQQQPLPQQQQQQLPTYGQQPQQQLAHGQPQQYAYVPVYANQGPGVQIQPSPGDEKDRPLPVPPNSRPAM